MDNKIYVVTYRFNNHEDWENSYSGAGIFFGNFSTHEKAKEAIYFAYSDAEKTIDELQRKEVEEDPEAVNIRGYCNDISRIHEYGKNAIGWTITAHGVMEYLFEIEEITMDVNHPFFDPGSKDYKFLKYPGDHTLLS